MEKFTVDLDAVLDEFEFNEGQVTCLWYFVYVYLRPILQSCLSGLDVLTQI